MARKAMKETLEHFAGDTTMHGLSQLTNAANLLSKLCWLLLLLAAIATFSAHLTSLAQRYLDHPVNIHTEYPDVDTPFPDITICNNAALSLGKIMFNRAAFNATGMFMKNDMFEGVDILQNASKKMIYELHRRVENLAYVKLSDTFGNGRYMLVQCLYQGDVCDMSTVKEIKLPGYGNCYTFPSPGNVVRAGEGTGYSIVVYTENKYPEPVMVDSLYDSIFDRVGILTKFEFNIPKAAGVRVIVHEKGSYPDPAEGVLVSNGYHWNIGLDLTEYTRDETDNVGCTRPDSPIGIRNYITGDVKNYTYTLKECRRARKQKQWFMTCGCLSEDNPIPANVTNSTDDFCIFSYNQTGSLQTWLEGQTNESVARVKGRIKCALDKLLENNIDDRSDQCKPPCKHCEYKQFLSQGVLFRDMPATHEYVHSQLYCPIYLDGDVNIFFPREWMEPTHPYHSMMTTINKLCVGAHGMFELVYNKTFLSQPSELETLRQNFLLLNIYFRSTVFEHIIQTPGYPVTNLFSDIGGILGLYVGVSVMTVCELLQLLLRLVSACCPKRGSMKPAKPDRDVEQ